MFNYHIVTAWLYSMFVKSTERVKSLHYKWKKHKTLRTASKNKRHYNLDNHLPLLFFP